MATGCDGLGAVGERRDRLRAADPVDLVDAGKPRGVKHERVQDAVRRRHRHDDARNAGDLGRHRVHQDRARIGGRAARHIEPDRVDRRPAAAELDAERVGEAVVLRQLAAVERFDPIARDRERVARRRGHLALRRVDLRRRDAQALGGDREAVEFLRVGDERRVAALAHVLDDPARRRLDVLRHLALRGKQRREARLEIRLGKAQADRHRSGEHVPRRVRRGPGRPEVGQLRFEHLDGEPDRRPAGEFQHDVAGGALAGLEADGEKIEHRVRLAGGRCRSTALS